jgi:hypothetical protein
MLEWGAIFSAIGGIFKPIADTIDNVHTSEEERLEAKAALTAVQAEVAKKWFDMEMKLMDLQAKIIQAEMQHGSWLTKSWRPLVMLGFFGMMVSHWFGFTPTNVSQATINWMMEIIKWGLGGYVIGRSAEKVVPKIVKALKNPEG